MLKGKWLGYVTMPCLVCKLDHLQNKSNHHAINPKDGYPLRFLLFPTWSMVKFSIALKAIMFQEALNCLSAQMNLRFHPNCPAHIWGITTFTSPVPFDHPTIPQEKNMYQVYQLELLISCQDALERKLLNSRNAVGNMPSPDNHDIQETS